MERLKHINQFNIVLGLWLIAAPFVLNYATRIETLGDITVGVVFIACSGWMLLGLQFADWCPWVQMLGGIWLIASPFVERYGQLSRPFTNDIIIGGLGILTSATIAWLSTSRQRRPA